MIQLNQLITNKSTLANHLGLSRNAVQRWFKVERFPPDHLIEIAKFYGIPPNKLTHLTGSDKSLSPKVLPKKKNTLEVLLRVQQGELEIECAAFALDLPEKSIQAIFQNWGRDLPVLYETLEALDQHQITIAQACERLKIAVPTLHGLRRKYGYAPGRCKATPGSGKSKIREAKIMAKQREHRKAVQEVHK